MNFGICNLCITPLRAEASDKSELVSQVLYGELFTILELQQKWGRIRLDFDGYEGWVDNKQYLSVSQNDYHSLKKKTSTVFYGFSGKHPNKKTSAVHLLGKPN